MSDLTPTYIAECPECGGLIGASVADVTRPSIKHAVRDRAMWEKAGYPVRTGTVQEVRDWKPPLGHTDACSRNREWRKRKSVTRA